MFFPRSRLLNNTPNDESWSKDLSASFGISVKEQHPKGIHQWPPCVLMDPLCSVNYARALSLADMVDMKVGRYCVNFIDHEYDHAMLSYFIWQLSDAILPPFPLFREHISMSHAWFEHQCGTKMRTCVIHGDCTGTIIWVPWYSIPPTFMGVSMLLALICSKIAHT